MNDDDDDDDDDDDVIDDDDDDDVSRVSTWTAVKATCTAPSSSSSSWAL